MRNENLLEAEQMSYKTLIKDSLNSTYLDTYAWILFKLNKFSRAKYYIEKAILNGGDDNHEIINHYGDILFKLNDIDNAIIKWEKAIKLGGDKELILKKIQEYK